MLHCPPPITTPPAPPGDDSGLNSGIRTILNAVLTILLVKLEGHLSNSIQNSSISGVQSRIIKWYKWKNLRRLLLRLLRHARHRRHRLRPRLRQTAAAARHRQLLHGRRHDRQCRRRLPGGPCGAQTRFVCLICLVNGSGQITISIWCVDLMMERKNL